MLIKNEFEVAEPVEKVWQFFDNIPQVAACLPGAELTEDLGDDKYKGKVAVRMGPVRLQFAGTADITERDEAAKRVVVHASGADEKGRGQASMVVTATLTRAGRGTKVGVTQDLQLSGAAAQYGRGMISDVSAVLMRDFSANMQNRIERIERGESAEQIARRRRHPGEGLHPGPAGRADGPEPGLPPVLPPVPARELKERQSWSCGGSATSSCWSWSCPWSSSCSTASSRRWSGSGAQPTTSWPAGSPSSAS